MGSGSTIVRKRVARVGSLGSQLVDKRQQADGLLRVSCDTSLRADRKALLAARVIIAYGLSHGTSFWPRCHSLSRTSVPLCFFLIVFLAFLALVAVGAARASGYSRFTLDEQHEPTGFTTQNSEFTANEEHSAAAPTRSNSCKQTYARRDKEAVLTVAVPAAARIIAGPALD
ncbi:hypothetical protein J6590_027007 [Homalodisca vitripennis]|nr:hypothetical protein J6590_027007 [Homalodisca vitripennis]